MVPASTGTMVLPDASLRRVIAASLIGTVIEWYDFFLYGTASALVFNKLFFPKADPLTGTLLAFATYALGFAARPIGGVVFGHFGDRIGRKRLLAASLFIMGLSTFAIGLLPTYRELGLWAAVLLVALRILQGFAVGGQWGGAVLLVAEHGDAARRGFWTSWPQTGVPAGNLLAAAILGVVGVFLNEQAFLAWGWRIPFLLSVVLVAVGLWLRWAVSEAPLLEQALKVGAAEGRRRRAPGLEALEKRPGGLAVGAGLRLGENVCYYVITAFSITYVTQTVGVSRSLALGALLIGGAVECVAVPLFGALSDRIGRRPVSLIGALGMMVWAFGFFFLLDQGTSPAVISAMVVGLVLHGAMYAPQGAFIAELFPTSYRYSGMSMAYQVTSIFAGSLAPIIALAAFAATHSTLPVSIYVCLTSLATAIAAFIARETKGESFQSIDARFSD